ncbi:MAG: DUF4252 domain-containing protein [Bacteroidota bacterium]
MKQLITTLLILVLGASQLFGQSNTVLNFAKEAEGFNVYLYQSLIRVMNKDKNPEFNQLIRDLDHIRFVTTEQGAGDAYPTFLELEAGIQSEGFESIMSFDRADQKCHVYELNSNNGQTTWVATMVTDEVAGLIEMKGMLDLKYLHAFNSLDMDQLEKMLPEKLVPSKE